MSNEQYQQSAETTNSASQKFGSRVKFNDVASDGVSRSSNSFQYISFGCLGLFAIGILFGMFVLLMLLPFGAPHRGSEMAIVHDFAHRGIIPVEFAQPPVRIGASMVVFPIVFLFFVAFIVGVIALVFLLVKQANGSKEFRTPSMPTKFCTHCGAEQVEGAYACPKCGFAARLKRAYCFNCGIKTDPEQIMCVQCGASLATSPLAGIPGIGGRKEKLVAGLFALLLGWLGIHKFYLESWGWGLVYLLLSWTGIPFIAGIIEGILFLTMDDPTFEQRYNQTQPAPFRW